MNNLRVTLTSLAAICALALASGASATPQTPILAWSHLFSTGTQDDYGNIAVDSAGNTYVIRYAEQRNPTQGPYTYHLSKILETGGVIDSQPFTFTQSGFQEVVIGRDGAIYVVVSEANPVPGATHLFKYNSSLQLSWERTFNFEFVGMSVDLNGLVHLAMGDSSYTGSLEMLTISASGVPSASVATSDIGASQGYYLKPYWVVSGVPTNGKGGAKWGVYTESNGTLIGSETTLDNFDKSTGLNTVHATAVYPFLGKILVATDTTTTPLQGYTGPNQFILQAYSITSDPGVLRQWGTTPLDGFLETDQLQTNDFGSEIYALAGPGNLYNPSNVNDDPSKLYRFNYMGQLDTVTTVPYESFRLNPNGYFSFEYNRGNNSATMQKHELDPTLAPDWSTTVAGNGTDTNLITVADGVFTANNVFTAALDLGNATTTQDFEVQRYVFGPTLALLAASSPKVKSGGTVTMKVLLTVPAGQGGVAVKLVSHDPHLLFPNNSTTYSAGLPNGSIYVNVTMHATTVTANTVVSVQGDERGVVKSAAVTITP
jgi:hypothetical protein